MNGKVNSEQFDYLYNRRGVKYLVHLTPVENLDSILKYGICPKRFMDKNGIRYKKSDERESSDKEGFSKYFISYPSVTSLEEKMESYESSFAILYVDCSVIELIDSDRIIYSQTAISDDMFWGSDMEYLESMFDDDVNWKGGVFSRSDYGLPDSYTTDPHAEVLIHCIIPPEFIKSCIIISYNGEDVSEYKSAVKRKKIRVNPDSFILNQQDEGIKEWSHQ